MGNLKLALASDHAGFQLKHEIIEFLKEQGIEYADYGAYSDDSSDYPDWGHKLADAIESGKFSLGISFCGSGNGINMTVNKHTGIRAALCWNVEIAKLSREHNDANVLSLPARFISKNEAIAMVKVFLETEFEGGRHLRRINKIPIE